MSRSIIKQLGLGKLVVAQEALRSDVDPATVNNGLVLRLAQQAHEVNRALCLSQGDSSQLPWDEASKEARISAISGVLHLLQDDANTPEQCHAAWMQGKLDAGWKLGDVKNEAAKTHPCLVPYGELPEHEQLKDNLFIAVVEAGLGVDTNVITDETDAPEVTEAQVAEVAAEGLALIRSMETLSTMSRVMELAPANEVNATNAALINVMVQGAIGTDAGERLMPSAESFGMGSRQVLVSYAHENMMDNIKENGKKIIDKIIELIQRFWQWLTMNHKRVKASLERVKKEVENTEGSAKLEMKGSWKTLMITSEFNPEKVAKLGEYLGELCTSAALFVTAGMNETSSSSFNPNVNIGGLESVSITVKAAFKGCHIEGDNIELYKGVGGRNLTITPAKRGGKFTPGFTTTLKKDTQEFEAPSSISVTREEARAMINTAIVAVEASEKEFDKVNRIKNKLMALTGLVGTAVPLAGYEMAVLTKLLWSYNRSLVAFIDGIFTQALRHGSAVASLSDAYVKHTKKVGEQAHQKDDAFVANAPMLAA